MHQLDEAIFLAEFEQVFIELVAGVVFFVFFPVEKIFCFGFDRSVAQAFTVIACKHKLDGGKEPFVELFVLVGQVLIDAITNTDTASFQFEHTCRAASQDRQVHDCV